MALSLDELKAELAEISAREILETLEEIQDNEINFQIACFFDEGFTVKLGDAVNGFKVTSPLCETWAEVADWLKEQVIICYPDSDFVRRKLTHLLEKAD